MKKFSLAFYLALIGCNGIPVPSPSPSNSPVPTPTPDPTSTPVVSACPIPLPEGSIVYIAAKPWGSSFRLDASVRVKSNTPEYCAALGHSNPSLDCHLEGYHNRLACEFELINTQLVKNGSPTPRAELCPVWQFNSVQNETGKIPCDDNQNNEASCDHFGSTQHMDDPQTPTTGLTLETLNGFEGTPLTCGLQRDNRNKPKAGFFMTGHGKGYFRACLPDYTNCSAWNYIDH